MLLKALFLIIIGSMIGWITNYVAIKMLFRPYKEINLGFYKIRGLIPKRRHEIAESIATIVETELISIDDIAARLKNVDMDSQLGKAIDDILDKKLGPTLIEKFPMMSMFLNDSMLKKIKSVIKNSIMDNKEEIMQVLFETLEKNVDFKEIIVEKVDGFSLDELEKIIFSLAKKELKHIEIIGAVLGGIIGAVQYAVTVLI